MRPPFRNMSESDLHDFFLPWCLAQRSALMRSKISGRFATSQVVRILGPYLHVWASTDGASASAALEAAQAAALRRLDGCDTGGSGAEAAGRPKRARRAGAAARQREPSHTVRALVRFICRAVALRMRDELESPIDFAYERGLRGDRDEDAADEKDAAAHAGLAEQPDKRQPDRLQRIRFVLRQALLPALAHSCGTGARVNRLVRNGMRFKSFPYAKFSVRKADPAERASRAATVVYVDNALDLRFWLETPDGVRFLGQLRDASGDICWSADPGMVSGAAPTHSFFSFALIGFLHSPILAPWHIRSAPLCCGVMRRQRFASALVPPFGLPFGSTVIVLPIRR